MMKKNLFAILILGFSFVAQAKEYRYEALVGKMKDSNLNEISLKGLKPVSIFDKLHWPCRLGDNAGEDLGQKILLDNPKAKLVRKIEMGIATWTLQGMASVDSGSCKNGTVFRLDENGNILSLSKEWENLRNIIIEYASQSCTIKEARVLGASRALSKDEVTAVADCFNPSATGPSVEVTKQYIEELKQMKHAAPEMDIGLHCARDLFKGEKNPKIIDCSRGFIEMASAITVTDTTVIACEDVAKEKREVVRKAAAIAICPFGKDAHFGKSSGYQRVFYEEGFCGFDRMQLESQRIAEQAIPERVYGCRFIDRKSPSTINKIFNPSNATK